MHQLNSSLQEIVQKECFSGKYNYELADMGLFYPTENT